MKAAHGHVTSSRVDCKCLAKLSKKQRNKFEFGLKSMKTGLFELSWKLSSDRPTDLRSLQNTEIRSECTISDLAAYCLFLRTLGANFGFCSRYRALFHDLSTGLDRTHFIKSLSHIIVVKTLLIRFERRLNNFAREMHFITKKKLLT